MILDQSSLNSDALLSLSCRAAQRETRKCMIIMNRTINRVCSVDTYWWVFFSVRFFLVFTDATLRRILANSAAVWIQPSTQQYARACCPPPRAYKNIFPRVWVCLLVRRRNVLTSAFFCTAGPRILLRGTMAAHDRSCCPNPQRRSEVLCQGVRETKEEAPTGVHRERPFQDAGVLPGCPSQVRCGMCQSVIDASRWPFLKSWTLPGSSFLARPLFHDRAAY